MSSHVLESISRYRYSCRRQLNSIRNGGGREQSSRKFIDKSQASQEIIEATAKYIEKLIETDRNFDQSTYFALDQINPLKIFEKYAGTDAINALGNCSVQSVMDWMASITGAFWIADLLIDGMINAEEHDELQGFSFGRSVFAVSLSNSAAIDNTIVVRITGEQVSCYLLPQDELNIFEDRSQRILFAIEAWDEFAPIYESSYNFKFIQRIHEWFDDVVGVFPALCTSTIERSSLQVLDEYYRVFKEKDSEITDHTLAISFDKIDFSHLDSVSCIQQSTFFSTINVSDQHSLLYLLVDTETKKNSGERDDEASHRSVSIHFYAVFTNDSKNEVASTLSHWLGQRSNLNLSCSALYSYQIGSTKHKLITNEQDKIFFTSDQADESDTPNHPSLLGLELGLIASLKWYLELYPISNSSVNVDRFQRILKRSFGDELEFIRVFNVRLPIKFWEELDYWYYDSRDIRVLLFAHNRPSVFHDEANWRFYSLEVDDSVDCSSDILDSTQWKLYASFPARLAENLNDAIKVLEAMMRAEKVQWNEELDSYCEEIEREYRQEADKLDNEEENNSWYGESLSYKLDSFIGAMDDYRYNWYYPVRLGSTEDVFIQESPLPYSSDVLSIPCSTLFVDDFDYIFEAADGQDW